MTISPLFYLKTMPPAVQVGKNDFPVLVKEGEERIEPWPCTADSHDQD